MISPRERNNFDLIRFAAASMVVLFHAQVLLANSTLPFLPLGDLAVQGFFVISGLLIVQSYDRSKSLADYALKRLRRIYPAYVFIVVTGALLGLLITTSTVGEYLGWRLARYLGVNLLFLNFLQPSLPGVFANNPVNDAVNGSLWTLKVEVAFYASVPVLVWLIRRIGAAPVVAAMYLGGAAWMIGWQLLESRSGISLYAELAKQLPGQAGYFAAGIAAAWYVRTKSLPALPMLAAGVLLFTVSWPAPYVVLGPIAIGLIVLGVGYGPYLGNFGRYGDFSYGIYIVHFPIIQAMIQYGLLTDRPWQFALASFGMSLAASIALWHLLERRFLRVTSHYRRSERDRAVVVLPGDGAIARDPAALP